MYEQGRNPFFVWSLGFLCNEKTLYIDESSLREMSCPSSGFLPNHQTVLEDQRKSGGVFSRSSAEDLPEGAYSNGPQFDFLMTQLKHRDRFSLAAGRSRGILQTARQPP
jgi:hypothetical protein